MPEKESQEVEAIESLGDTIRNTTGDVVDAVKATMDESGAAATEAANEERRRSSKMFALFSGMKSGIMDMGKKLGEKAKAVGGSMFDMIKKAALFMLIPALIAFMNSPLFDKLKTFIIDKLIPALKLMTGIIVDIATTLTSWVTSAVDWIILAFTDPKAVLDMLWRGISNIAEYIYNNALKPAWDWIKLLFTDPVAALKGLVSSFGSLVDWIFNNTFLKAWNWITGLFGFEPVADTFSLWDTMSAVFDEVKAWFIGLFKWGRALGMTKDGTWSLSTMIDNAFTLVKDWVVGLFKWGRAAGETADGKWSLATMIDAAFLKAKEWAVSLFTWLLAPEGESWIQKTVSAAVTKVKAWATSLFTWSSTDNPDDPWLTTKIKDAINLVKDWVTGLFSWVSTAGQVDGKPWSLSTMVDAAVLKVKDWVVSLFTWATDPEGESWIQKIVSAAVTKVKDWAKSLFAWAELPGDSWISQKVKDVINLAKAWVTSLFSWVATAGQVDGKPWSAITLVQEIIGKAIGWVKSLFSWATTDEVTDPAGFSLLSIITAPLKLAIKWITGLFGWAAEAGKVDGEDWSLSTMIKAAVDTAIGWVKGLFDWVVGGPKVLWTGLTTYVSGIWTSVKDWFTGLFSWGTTDEASIAKPEDGWLSKIFKSIFPRWVTEPVAWLKEKLGIGVAKKDGEEDEANGFFANWKMPSLTDIAEVLPGWLTDPIGFFKNMVGGKTEGMKKALEGGFYDKDLIGASEIDRKKLKAGLETGDVDKDMLKAILEDDDLREKDVKFMEALLKQASTPGSLYVRDDRLLDFLSKGADFAKNAQLMQAANAETGRQGGANVNNNMPVVVNAPSQSAVAHTKVETAIGLSDPYTHLERAY